MTHTYSTDFTFSVSGHHDALQYDAELRLEYTVTPGAGATSVEPGYGPSVNIHSASIITGHGTRRFREDDAPNWLWSFIEGDEELHGDMLAAASDQDAYAADQAADAKREDQMLERHQ